MKNPTAITPNQKRWFENEWIVIEKLNDQDLSNLEPPTKNLILQFSVYKYGDKAQINSYAERLASSVRKHLGTKISQTPTEWAVVSFPFLSIELVSDHLAKEIAKRLSLPYVELRTKVLKSRGVIYPMLKSLQERIIDKTTAGVNLDSDGPVNGKHVILIEDLINTGASVGVLSQALMEQGAAASVHVFAMISLETKTPEIEEDLNHFLLSYDPNKLIEILNNPNNITSRNTLRLLNDPAMAAFVTSRLSSSALKRLLQKAPLYNQKIDKPAFQRLGNKLRKL